VDERERDASGQVYMTAAELMAEEVRRRGGEGPAWLAHASPSLLLCLPCSWSKDPVVCLLVGA
jgi:hypothetical protein